MSYDRESQAAEQSTELMEMLASQDLDDRLMAIRMLGEIGDEAALGALRARMTRPLEEYFALTIAVGRLKERLGKK